MFYLHGKILSRVVKNMDLEIKSKLQHLLTMWVFQVTKTFLGLIFYN